MTSKDVASLAAFNLVFIILAVAALIFANGARDYADLAKAKEREKKFETFVQNVESGKWELTRDRWIDLMRRHRKIEEAERESLISISGGCGTRVGLDWAQLVFKLQ